MPPYLSPLHLIAPTLPPLCEPENEFLYHVSATFHSCIPTNLAFISTLLGTLSIVSWLFAQLPQVYKNYKIKSTSGLSVYFLTEWLLGDLCNLLGGIFTKQAAWQVIIAGYYVSVDCALCGQWVWYTLLGHGRPERPALDQLSVHDGSGKPPGNGTIAEYLDGVSIASSTSSPPNSPPAPTMDKKDQTKCTGNQINTPPQRSNPMDVWRIPNFAYSPAGSAKDEAASSLLSTQTSLPTTTRTLRPIVRGNPSSNSPLLSPRTVIYLALLISLLSQNTVAKPISPFSPSPYTSLSSSSSSSSPSANYKILENGEEKSPTALAGQILSWLSTALYLSSRLPQLLKNYRRRSTAGLSASLFIAAFFGNLFYSTSLLTNPCAWNDFAPGEGKGWVGENGSRRKEWVGRALPFFLGAAGVLGLDGMVGVQFWVWGEGGKTGTVERGRREVREEVLGGQGGRPWTWRRASGWMRGWVPSVSVAGTPIPSRAVTPVNWSRDASPAPSGRSVGSVRSVRGIRGGGGNGDALDEARQLLGTSPRRYGGIN